MMPQHTGLDSIADDDVFDLIVVGAGGAGMATALFAAIEGLRVLLVEHTAHVGGTTALSAGTIWIPNTHLATSVDAEDSPAQAATFLRQVVGNRSSEGMRAAFLRHGPQAVATLEAASEVKLRARPLHPDYMQEAEGATLRGRALEAHPFDGRRLGADLALIRPPIPEFTLFGGMMVDRDDIPHLLNATRRWNSFAHAARLLGRYGLDRLRFGRGARLLMGNALVGRLLLSLRQRGVAIVTQVRVDDLLHGEAGVSGVVLAEGARRLRAQARHGVVMASGGFTRNAAIRARLLPPLPVHSPTAPGCTGAMHDFALALGATHGEGAASPAFWSPVSVRRRPDGSEAVFPHFVLDRAKPGFLAVDAAGQRFVNEATSYHLFVLAMFSRHATTPCIPAFLITDAEGLRKYGIGMVRPGARSLQSYLADGYLTEAPTLAKLAEQLGIDPDGLAATVEQMNRSAVSGSDPAFGRGTTAYHHVNGDASQRPNPNLGPIATAPFYAVQLYPGDIGAATGLVTNEQAQVLGADGHPIVGLYAVGNDMQSVMGGTYPGPGITLGPALTFAWIAARHASALASATTGSAIEAGTT